MSDIFPGSKKGDVKRAVFVFSTTAQTSSRQAEQKRPGTLGSQVQDEYAAGSLTVQCQVFTAKQKRPRVK